MKGQAIQEKDEWIRVVERGDYVVMTVVPFIMMNVLLIEPRLYFHFRPYKQKLRPKSVRAISREMQNIQWQQ